MILRLGERADAVHELESRREGLELERALEGAVDLLPIRGSHTASIYDR